MADPDETQVISSPYHRDYGDEKKNSYVAYFGGKFKIKIGPFCMKGNFNYMDQLGKSNHRNSLKCPRYLLGGQFKNEKN